MKNASFKIAAGAMLVASVFASQAYAAGFQLSEQSSIQMGRAMAGAGVMGDDLSAVHYNPAGMTLLEGTRIQATGTWVGLNAEYKGEGGATENGRKKGQLIPAGFITHQVNDQLWLGLGLTVPYGMGIDFDRNWEGAERGNKSTILTFDMNPNVAWKINEKFSVGGGLSLQYAKAKLGMAKMGIAQNTYGMNSTVEGDSWAWGWNVGLMFRPVETVRLGIAYRSHIAHNADGETTIDTHKGLTKVGQGMMAQGQALIAKGETAKGTALIQQGGAVSAVAGQTFVSDMKVRIKTPDTLTFSAAWDATQDLTLSATARWSKWSNFDTLTIENSGFHGGNIPLANDAMNQMAATSQVHNKWDDTWFFSLGADYRLNEQLTVRGGVAYDQGPVDNAYRIAVIPDTDRVWVSGGASYKFNKNMTFDFGATYITGVGDTDLYDASGKKRIGEFKSLDSYIVSAQMQYLF